ESTRISSNTRIAPLREFVALRDIIGRRVLFCERFTHHHLDTILSEPLAMIKGMRDRVRHVDAQFDERTPRFAGQFGRGVEQDTANTLRAMLRMHHKAADDAEFSVD